MPNYYSIIAADDTASVIRYYSRFLEDYSSVPKRDYRWRSYKHFVVSVIMRKAKKIFRLLCRRKSNLVVIVGIMHRLIVGYNHIHRGQYVTFVEYCIRTLQSFGVKYSALCIYTFIRSILITIEMFDEIIKYHYSCGIVVDWIIPPYGYAPRKASRAKLRLLYSYEGVTQATLENYRVYMTRNYIKIEDIPEIVLDKFSIDELSMLIVHNFRIAIGLNGWKYLFKRGLDPLRHENRISGFIVEFREGAANIDMFVTFGYNINALINEVKRIGGLGNNYLNIHTRTLIKIIEYLLPLGFDFDGYYLVWGRSGYVADRIYRSRIIVDLLRQTKIRIFQNIDVFNTVFGRINGDCHWSYARIRRNLYYDIVNNMTKPECPDHDIIPDESTLRSYIELMHE